MSRLAFAPLVLLPCALIACNSERAATCEGAERLWVGSFEATEQEDLEELRCIEVVSGDVRLSGVTSLEPLGSLVQVLGDLSLRDNPSLASAEGLGSLTEIGGSLRLDGNDALTSLTGLGPVRELENLTIEYNDALRDLSGLESLRAIRGALVVTSNASLASLPFGRESLAVSLGGSVEVSFNDSLTELSLTRLDADTAVPFGRHDIFVGDNRALQRFSFDVSWTRERRIEVSRNGKLATITADAPSSALARLDLQDLPALKRVELSSVRFGALEIVRTGLTDLMGFGNLNVACELTLIANGALTSAASQGGKWTGPFATAITVLDNARLPSCQVEGLVAQLREPRVACADPVTGLVPRNGRELNLGGNNDDAVCE